ERRVGLPGAALPAAVPRSPERRGRRAGGGAEVDDLLRVAPPLAEGPLPDAREAEVQVAQAPRDGRHRIHVRLRFSAVGEDLLDSLGAHAPVVGDPGDRHAGGPLPGHLGVLARRDVRGALVEEPVTRAERPGGDRLAAAPHRPAAGHRLPQVLVVAETLQTYLRHLPGLVELVEQQVQPARSRVPGRQGGPLRVAWSRNLAPAEGRPRPDFADGRRAAPPQPRASARTASVNGGHASTAHGPKARSARAAQARPASGSIHRKVPDWPKWPKVRGEDAEPVQCGDLPSRISKPRPQSLGFWWP